MIVKYYQWKNRHQFISVDIGNNDLHTIFGKMKSLILAAAMILQDLLSKH